MTDDNIIATAMAQRAKGFPQTAGELVLTSDRLELIPHQFASLGFGKPFEVALADIERVSLLGRFEGPALIGSLGRKIALHMCSGERHVMSFYLSSDIETFFARLEEQLGVVHER